jgi:hypothetical protein
MRAVYMNVRPIAAVPALAPSLRNNFAAMARNKN